MTRMRAMWPVLDEDAPMALLQLEALYDLPEVAARAHFLVEEVRSTEVTLGRYVPGSGGARLVVVVTCEGQYVGTPEARHADADDAL